MRKMKGREQMIKANIAGKKAMRKSRQMKKKAAKTRMTLSIRLKERKTQ